MVGRLSVNRESRMMEIETEIKIQIKIGSDSVVIEIERTVHRTSRNSIHA